MFKKIMKKFLGNILLAIGIVIGVPILLIVSIGYLFYVPFDIVRYHKMPYYIDLKRKYEFFITSSEAVKVYNHITREKLPMKYFKNEDFEYFVKDEEALICGWSHCDFERKNDEWYFFFDGDEDRAMSTNEIIELDSEQLLPEHQGLPVKILMICEEGDAERMEKIKECPRFHCFLL